MVAVCYCTGELYRWGGRHWKVRAPKPGNEGLDLTKLQSWRPALFIGWAPVGAWPRVSQGGQAGPSASGLSGAEPVSGINSQQWKGLLRGLGVGVALLLKQAPSHCPPQALGMCRQIPRQAAPAMTLAPAPAYQFLGNSSW